jgi:hypothetical protein
MEGEPRLNRFYLRAPGAGDAEQDRLSYFQPGMSYSDCSSESKVSVMSQLRATAAEYRPSPMPFWRTGKPYNNQGAPGSGLTAVTFRCLAWHAFFSG